MKPKFLLFFLLTYLPIYGQLNLEGNFPPPDTPQVVQAIKTTSEIQVDGILDEEAWLRAPVVKNFFRKEPRQGGDYQYETEVQVLFDKKNLYVGFFCKDSLGVKGIRIQDLRRDFEWGENDIFGIALDPQNLKQYCVAFQTTPYGNQRDFQNFNGNVYDNGWNTLWKVRTRRTDKGYYGEFSIPFKSLRYDKIPEADSISWGITLVRYARRDNEQTIFPPIPQSFTPYRMTYAAQLKGLELPPASSNIRIEPYTLFQLDENKQGDVSNSSTNLKIGGDVKWAVNPNTVVDLTFNTDFAQAEVDRAVNNLERFNIFFPERRQFFLENSGIWAGGLQTDIRPFFSRRIGLQGDFNAAPAPIDAGFRFTQRDEKKAFAGLYIHQRESENTAGASFGVLRYLKNYGKENNIGVMLTHRRDETSDELNLDQKNNTTFTIDGLIRPKSEWSIAYILSASRDFESNQNGFAGRIFAGNTTNNHYFGWVTGIINKDYNPDMGFVIQKNVLWHNPGGYWIWRPKNIKWIRRWDPGMFASYYHDADRPGNFQQASLYIFPIYVFFQDGSFFEYSFTPTWQNINFDFAPLGLQIEKDNYFYVRQLIRFNTDESKKLSLNGRLNWGKFYDGRRFTTIAGLRFAPNPRMAFTADYEFNNLRDIGQENQDLKTHLVTGGLRLAANPRLQLSIFYQYNSFGEVGRWNVRGSWEFQPLSFVYLVFNENDFSDLDRMNRSAISKISYIRQF